MKRLLFIICALLFVSAGAFAQVGAYSSTALDSFGKRISTPTVKVCAVTDTACSTPVTIYKDASSTALSNPFTGDTQGNYTFFAAGGNYTVQVAKAGYLAYTYPVSISSVLNAAQFPGADILAQANAAIATLPTRVYGGGTYAYGQVYIPSGSYTATATLGITSPFVAVTCAEGTRIDYTGSGDAVRVQATPFPSGSDWHAEGITGCNLYGTGAGASGVHIGDVVGFQLRNMEIANFTAGSGLWFDNETNWTERTQLIGVNLANNLKGWRFTTGGTGTNSFGYTRAIDSRFVVRAGQDGLRLESGTLLYNSIINAVMNVADPTGTAVHVLNGAVAQDNVYAITGECVNTVACSGASLATIDTGGTMTGTGFLMGLNGSMGLTLNGTFHIAGMMMPNNNGYRLEWNPVDNSWREYFNNTPFSVGFSAEVRNDPTRCIGFTSGGVTATAIDTCLSRSSAGVLAVGTTHTPGDHTGTVWANAFKVGSANLPLESYIKLNGNGAPNGTSTGDAWGPLQQPITVDQVNFSSATAPAGCTTAAVVTVTDCSALTAAGSCTSAATVASVTLVNGNIQYPATVSSASVPAGHYLAYKVTTGQSGCTTAASGLTANVQVH